MSATMEERVPSGVGGGGGAGGGGGGAGGRKKPMLGNKQQFKWFSFDVDNSSRMSPSGSTAANQSRVRIRDPALTQRRPSFLYRSESQDDLTNHSAQSGEHVTSGDGSGARLKENGFHEDQIVTPFAQILHRLQSARAKYAQHAGLTTTQSTQSPRSGRRRAAATSNPHRNGDLSHPRVPSPRPDVILELPAEESGGGGELSREILEELDWCLERLELIQRHKSVSDLASSKFKRILNKELSHLAESSKAGSQVSEYISNTFLDNESEEKEGLAPLPSDRKRPGGGQGEAPGGGPASAPCLSPMSQISVHRSLGRSSSCRELVPKYGVDNVREDSLEPLMVNLDVWGIDIFKIDGISNGHSLTVIAYRILQERELLSKLSLPAREVVNYLRVIQSSYLPAHDVPYHNHLHAADVTQSVHALLALPALQDVFSELEMLALLLAAVIHDVDHPGVTNQYLVNTASELALMYNDESVLENHHLAVAFKLLQSPDCDFLRAVPPKTRHKLRHLVIDLVLATDMSKHMSLLAELKTMVETRNTQGSTPQLLLDCPSSRLQVMQNMLHCADLSNPTKPLDLYRQWTGRIMEEFFKQGDRERARGLDISPMCDRLTATVEKSQVGFIDFIVSPLWETWAEFVSPDCSDILDTLDNNRLWYQERMTALAGGASSREASPTSPDSSASPQEETSQP